MPTETTQTPSHARADRLIRELAERTMLSPVGDGPHMMRLLAKANEPEASVLGDLLQIIVENGEST